MQSRSFTPGDDWLKSAVHIDAVSLMRESTHLERHVVAEIVIGPPLLSK